MKGPLLGTMLEQAARPYRSATRLAIACAVVAVITGIALLGLAGWFITGAALAGAAGIVAVQAFNYLLPSAAIRLLAITRTVTRYGERFYGHKAALSALADFRVVLFERLISAPETASPRGAGDLAALLIQDVDALEDRFVRQPGQIAALVGAATALAFAVPAGWAATAALAAIILAVVIAARLLARRWLPEKAQAIQQDIAALKQVFVEYAAASPEIAAYALAGPVEAQLQRQAARLDTRRTAFARAEAMLAALVTAAGGLAMAAILGLSEASLPLTLLAALAAAGAVEGLSAAVRSSGRDAVIAAGLARLAALVGTAPVQYSPAPPLAGDQITITQSGRTLVLNRGDRLVVTGPSGCGKTSLLETIAGQRDAACDVTIDGDLIQAIPADQRRALFALSPQNAQMIAGTIADNLGLARPGLTADDMWRALEAACLADAVRAMPEGLGAWVGDGGTRLSGGERKRLSLARALLARRRWLLLDEPSEGLDPHTECVMQANLDRWLAETGTGLILVTHRDAMLPLGQQYLAMDG